jgi:hypothetical protein
MIIAPVTRRAYTYTISVASKKLSVNLNDVKDNAVITSCKKDGLITLYTKAAIDYAEKITRRDFTERTYETFRDCFPVGFGNVGFELRKSPLISVEKIEHFVSGSLVTVDDTLYYNTLEGDYSEVLTVDQAQWPDNTDVRKQAIVITFKAGFSVTPEWVTEGVAQHVAEMYTNRGDCGSCGDTEGKHLPAVARALYMQNRIENL